MEEVGKNMVPRSVYQDRSGTIWTTTSDGLLKYVPGQRDFVRNHVRNETRDMMDAAVDSSGTVWILDEREGLFRLAGDTLVQAARLPPSNASAIILLCDRRGRKWILREDGLFVFERGELRTFDRARGEIPPLLRTVFEDRAGTIWVVSAAGLSRFEGGTF